MKRYCYSALLSLAALNFGAGQASAAGWLRGMCCCDQCAMCCKQYNAFSPACMQPTCVKCWWPFRCCKQPCCPQPCCQPQCDPCCQPSCDPCCGPAESCCSSGGCSGPGCGAPMMSHGLAPAPAGQGAPPASMPPASAAPNYMPPAPSEVPNAPQSALPGMYGYQYPMMQPVAYHPAYYPQQAYYAHPGYYGMPQQVMPGYGMPQQMMPGYGMPQGAMPATWTGPRSR